MNCRVCGRQFDPTGFQVMVPGIKDGFDRVDCALEASALRLPPARSVDPLPTVVPALPPAPAGVPVLAGGPPGLTMAASARPQLLVGANLALLAAAAAATIYLWLRVFGPDAGLVSLPAASASPAFERSTVAATIDLSAATRPQPESAVAGGGSQPASPALAPALAATGGDDATLVSNTSKPRRARQNGGPVVRPSPPAPPPAPPAEPGPTRSAPVPTFPVPTSPPGDRVPGPTLPGGGAGGNTEQPGRPGSGGTRG